MRVRRVRKGSLKSRFMANEPNQLGEGQAKVYIGIDRRSLKVEQRQQGRNDMKLHAALFLVGTLASMTVFAPTATAFAADSKGQVTILYDAFGKDAAMKKDWGFSALVEVAGKRILFDTGNDPEVFASNVKAKNVDLSNLDFVVLSHRHSDHMAGLSYVLSVNPKVKIYAPKEGFGIFGSSLPASFYRKDESLPPDMRYYGGTPPEVMKFGTAWQGANFELIDKTTEVAPGIALIALVSDAPGTIELKELSLAVNTPDGVVLLVGCAHPGILVKQLDAAGLPPQVAMWVHSPDTDIWKLWIVPPESVKDKQGFYRKVAEIITKHRDEIGGLSASDIEMVPISHPAMAGISTIMRVEGLSSIHFSGNRFNGYYLPDGIVLRAVAERRTSPRT
jgi:metal-dependent hydrolase (beta-lactamase superfamily II)